MQKKSDRKSTLDMEQETKVLNLRDIESYAVEYIDQAGITGIVIHALNGEGETIEVKFLHCDRDDIEAFIIDNGEEDYDYTTEEGWFDCEHGDGFSGPIYIVCEDLFEENMLKYALKRKKEWVQGED